VPAARVHLVEDVADPAPSLPPSLTHRAQGEIYIRFASPAVAVVALQGLNGRWFGGKQISAAHVGDSLFDAKK